MTDRRNNYQPIKSDHASEIAELAEFLADEYFPNKKIEPLELVREQKITHSFDDFGDAFDGLLEYGAGRFHLYANITRLKHIGSPRARFTFSHELGHYFIDSHRNALKSGLLKPHPSFCEYESNWEIETEADHFASHLLMPKSRFAKQARQAQRGIKGITKLADYFGTSMTATAVRYVKEEVVPCAIFKWQPDGKLQWKHLSTETFRARFFKPVETINALPFDSPTAKIHCGEDGGINYLQAGTTAATWFRHVQAGSDHNVIFIEEAMQLGQFGVLTFLYPEASQY
jgi:hypothetical protein